MRGAGGSLLWVGREARPDVAASCAMTMAWGKGGPTVQNIKFCNKVIQELRSTSEAYLRIIPIPLEAAFGWSFPMRAWETMVRNPRAASWSPFATGVSWMVRSDGYPSTAGRATDCGEQSRLPWVARRWPWMTAWRSWSGSRLCSVKQSYQERA